MSEPSEAQSLYSLQDYLAITRRGWRLIAIIVVVAVVGAFAWSSTETPMYRASTVISVSPVVGVDDTFSRSSVIVVQGEIEVLTSSATAQRVAEMIGERAAVSVAPVSEDTASIKISATSPDAELAARTANAYAAAYTELRKELDLERNAAAANAVQASLDEVEGELFIAAAEQNAPAPEGSEPDPAAEPSAQVSDLRTQQRTYQQQLRVLEDQARFIEQGRVAVINPAGVPSEPYSPNTRRNVATAFVLALAIGIGLVFLREYFNDAIRDSHDLDAATRGLPVLGLVPLDPKWREVSETHVSVLENPRSSLAEAYRAIRLTLQFVRIDDPVRVIQVTSSRPGDGKSTTVANLGATLALEGQRVLLVDLDLRRPRLHSFFKLSNEVGFTSLVVDPDLAEEAITTTGSLLVPSGLHVLPTGPLPTQPAELLGSRRAAEVLTDLASRYDTIIIDSPPVLGVSDPLVISANVDATILVVRSNVSTRRDVRTSLDMLARVEAPMIGVIANSVSESDGYYGYAYGYGYGYGYGYRNSKDRPGTSGSVTVDPSLLRRQGDPAPAPGHDELPVEDQAPITD